jgi:signal transduction histidine kinase
VAAALVYAISGSVWVIASEWLFESAWPIADSGVVHVARDLAFIALTTAILYALLSRMLRALQHGNRNQTALARDVRTRARDQRRLSHRLMRAEEETRRAVAKDLHDGALQSLTLSFMQLDAAVRSTDEGVMVDPAQVQNAMTAIREASDEIRAVVRALHPPLLAELGLGPAVERYCRELTQRANREILLQRDPQMPDLPPQTAITIFRIAQEALANALKHTQGGAISVTLGFEGSAVALEVRDFGPGFDLAESTSGGLGLISMRERAESIGAELVLASDSRGTAVQVRVPDASVRL